MIDRTEILTLAKLLDLRPETVEKDYILGWILHGIQNHKEFFNHWVFKGGTSLKKCFFETYRFSEDLDYTLTNPEHLDKPYLEEAFKKIARWIYEESGIECPEEVIKFKIINKGNGKFSAQGKFGYKAHFTKKDGHANIKLDLTNNEVLILQPVELDVHHPYSDNPVNGIKAKCYAFEEVIAEKIRALAQRARPRDLYDVIHLFRNRALITNHQLLYSVLSQKCKFKELAVPTFSSIENHQKIDELRSEWHNMLAHQLSLLPDLDTFWSELPLFFEWLETGTQKEALPEIGSSNETIWEPGRIVGAYSSNLVLERIQFAAANRVRVSLKYHNKNRTIEPLSFRISSKGNKLFYGYEVESKGIKAFALDKIQDVIVKHDSFIPKYLIEISNRGRVSMPLVESKMRNTPFGRISGSKFSSNNGPIYVFECSWCGKKFKRKTNNSKLNPHKDKDGYPCNGRMGLYFDTKY
jgi:predicted nucleotidyltransferase component of viral defense system